MTNEEQILEELKKINYTLAKSSNSVSKSFFIGFVHTLGGFFGYLLILGVLAYLATKVNWTKAISTSFESIMGNINWQKVVPAPKLEIDPRLLQ